MLKSLSYVFFVCWNALINKNICHSRKNIFVFNSLFIEAICESIQPLAAILMRQTIRQKYTMQAELRAIANTQHVQPVEQQFKIHLLKMYFY